MVGVDFPGAVDNLVVSSVTASEHIVLPDNVLFTKETPARLDFDASGYLNREVHSAPAGLELEFDDGTRELVRVGMYGTVE